ncbi:heavy metal translocating P-type ATPase [Vibrio lamellibrachiae]|uniref:heavy metal translocating P-type ATPase n=1 Tax=Vibrio lamellibrachiae TaxID=2910253 RepID=UPI003D13C53D
MNRYQIPLIGLNCLGCARKVEQAIAEEHQIITHELTKDLITLESEASYRQLVVIIQALGYQAGQQLHYKLSGLSCGRCVGKLKQLLEQQNTIAEFTVTKDHLTVNSIIESSEVKSLVSSLGFSAQQIEDAAQANETSMGKSSGEAHSSEGINKPSNKTVPETVKQASTHHFDSIHLSLTGMTCASCVSSVEKSLHSVSFVEQVQVNLAEQSAIIEVSDSSISTQKAIILAIKQAGYNAEVIDDPLSAQEKQKLHLEHAKQVHKNASFYALLIGGPLMIWGMLGGNMMIRSVGDQIVWGAIGLLCLLLMATSGRSFYVNAYKALTHRRATMDSLVSLGTGAAWLYSMLMVLVPFWFPENARHVYFEATAMILGLISLGHYIEVKAKAKTTQSLQALINLQPQTATLVTEKGDESIAVEAIQKSMVLRIRPGEKIPVDGIVLSGESYLDEAMLTGESIPALKQINDNVSAGTLNQDGSLTIAATGVGSDTMLARIIQLVRRAQSSKSEIAKLADQISSIFVPIVIAIALVAVSMWYFFGPEPKLSYMLIVATTVLIIACPCALGLATPLSVTVGVGKAAEMGILIRDADVLQTASKITTVVFDKTGTLTQGTPEVQKLFAFGVTESELLQNAYSAERHSEHPLAKSISKRATALNISAFEIENFQNLKGEGVTAKLNNQSLIVGSLSYIESQQINIDEAKNAIKQCQENAWTQIAVSLNDKLIGVIALSDSIKEDAKAAIAALKQQQIKTVMLTGDNQAVARAIAIELGIDSVISQVLPDEKALHITHLQADGSKVAMVGDGVNDAPALAQADMGIAMGSGSDVAIESAQMTLLNSSPLAVVNAIDLSKATVRNIKQNLFGAFIYNSLGIPIAAGVLFPAFGFLLSPVVAGAAMALSSITVVSNANRLRLFKPSFKS